MQMLLILLILVGFFFFGLSVDERTYNQLLDRWMLLLQIKNKTVEHIHYFNGYFNFNLNV